MDTKTVLTIIGSFLAASTAQIVSHFFTLKRETKNYQKACYQHLYSPTIFKLTDYIKAEGDFLYKPPANPAVIFNELMSHIGDNLKYTNVDVINIYHVWERDYAHSPINVGVELENEMDLRITLANMFFSHFIEINESLKFKHKIVSDELKGPYFFTHLFLLIRECTRPYSITHDEIFKMYDLVEAILLPTNNYTERIIAVRKNLNNVLFSKLYKNSERVEEAYLSAYELLYDIVNAFADISEDRANDLKELLDASIQK